MAHCFFDVVNYLGISIPSKSEYYNLNNGLQISQVTDGIGLVGTIEMLNQSKSYLNCRHEPYSKEQISDIAKKMRSGFALNPYDVFKEPMEEIEARNYSIIFDVLGLPMLTEEIIKFSTGEYNSNPELFFSNQ